MPKIAESILDGSVATPTAFQGLAHPEGEVATVRCIFASDHAVGSGLANNGKFPDVIMTEP